MKKILLILAGLTLLGRLAYAAPAQEDFRKFYTVDSIGSTVEKNTFSLSETPFLFVKLPPVNNERYGEVFTNWIFGSSVQDSANTTGILGQEKFWLSPLNWSSIAQPGTWLIDGSYFIIKESNDSLKKFGNTSYNFTVTPEPISMMLFGLGGAVLGLVGLRRKKIL